MINDLDSPVIVFVSGNDLANAPAGSNCQTAAARAAARRRCATPACCACSTAAPAQEIWTLANIPSSIGFAGMSVAIGDVDGDGIIDIVAATGEGYVVLLDSTGNVKRTSDKPIPGDASATFGWGGGLSIADMDGDGFPEIAYGATVYTTTNGAITLKFTGTCGIGGGRRDGGALHLRRPRRRARRTNLELLAGNTAYKSRRHHPLEPRGAARWPRLPDGFPGVGDFNGDGKPDVVLVGPQTVAVRLRRPQAHHVDQRLRVDPRRRRRHDPARPGAAAHHGSQRATAARPRSPTSTATGKPRDRRRDGRLLLDAQAQLHHQDDRRRVEDAQPRLQLVGHRLHRLRLRGRGAPRRSSTRDECYLWVFDGATGAVRFSAPHTSFTGTEASLVADVDGDGHAEILMVTNGADPSSAGWGCLDADGQPR